MLFPAHLQSSPFPPLKRWGYIFRRWKRSDIERVVGRDEWMRLCHTSMMCCSGNIKTKNRRMCDCNMKELNTCTKRQF